MLSAGAGGGRRLHKKVQVLVEGEGTEHSQQVWARKGTVSNRGCSWFQSGSQNQGGAHRGAKAEKDVGGFQFLYISKRDSDRGGRTFPVKAR